MKPTPAQIEAAARAMKQYIGYCSVELARVALTAAAEIGAGQIISETTWQKEKARIYNLAIERCAQVAETFPNAVEWQTIYTAGIAAAIRAMKDK